MPKNVGGTKGLLIFGPYPPGPKSKSHSRHIMVRVCGGVIDTIVPSDNDDLGPALAVIEAELRRRLVARRQAQKRVVAQSRRRRSA